MQSQAECLIEITVMHLPIPSDTDKMSAHQAIDRGRIEGLRQFLHVFSQGAYSFHVSSESPDGHIGEDEQVIEGYSVPICKFFPIVVFKVLLLRRQECPWGVVDKIQLFCPSVLSVTKAVKPFDCLYTPAKGALPSDSVYEAFQEVRE